MASTAMDLMKDPNYIDPELAKLIKAYGPPSSLDATTDIQQLRAELLCRKRQVAQATGGAETTTKETDVQIETRDGSLITVRIYQPLETTAKPGPVMVMLHGGGWILGGLDNEQPLCRRFVEELGGVSFNVDYRLAPEHKFPTAVYDSYDALLWTAKHAAKYGGDTSTGFIVGGISAGGSMAAAISHLYRDEKQYPRLTGIYLSIPSLLAPEAVPENYQADYLSRQQFKNGLVINEKAMRLFRNLYEDDPRSPLMSPAAWPSGHRGLPQTYFQIAGSDPLRDEALIYEKVLREESGVTTKADLYPGLPHGFWSWWPNADFTKRHAKDAVAGLRWLVEQSP